MMAETKKSNLPRIRARVAAVAISAALLVLGSLIGAWWLLGGAHMSSPRTIADLLASSPELKPSEATEELCWDPGCLEGWRTEVGDFLRFDTSGEAEYWAILLGDDGRHYENFVLDFRGRELSFEKRRLGIDILFSHRDWY